MSVKAINSSLMLLSKLGESRQESASKTASSHICKKLKTIIKNERTDSK